MAEFIKRETAIKRVMETKWESGSDGAAAMEIVAATPAADVAPVVRCKDCKHKGWVQEPCHGKSVDYCKIWDCTLRNLEATFCSYGEQKDGGASDVRIAD